MKKVRWGVLSTAGIAQKSLLPAFLRAENAQVTAIATSSDLQKAERVAETFGIEKVYASYEALLADEEIDAVYIPLPNHLHKQWVIQSAQAGKHVLCEKPIALTAEDVQEMEKVCQAHDVLLMEAFMYYFHPQHTRVRALLAEGAIGEVTSMTASFSFYLDESRRASSIKMQKEMGGGSIYDIGCYGIHAIRNVLQMEPETVQTHARVDEATGVDTDAVGYMTFANGVYAIFDCSFNTAMRHQYAIHGTEGSIVLPRAFRPDNHGGEGRIEIHHGNSLTIEMIQGDQYCFEVEQLSAAILEGKKEVPHSLKNTYENMAVIDAAYRSISSGKVEQL